MRKKTATLPALLAASVFGTGAMFIAGCPEDFETEPMDQQEPAPQQEPAQPDEPADQFDDQPEDDFDEGF